MYTLLCYEKRENIYLHLSTAIDVNMLKVSQNTNDHQSMHCHCSAMCFCCGLFISNVMQCRCCLCVARQGPGTGVRVWARQVQQRWPALTARTQTDNCDHRQHDGGHQIAEGGQHEDQPGLLAGAAPGLVPGAGGHPAGGVQLGPADGQTCQFRAVNIVRTKKTGG